MIVLQKTTVILHTFKVCCTSMLTYNFSSYFLQPTITSVSLTHLLLLPPKWKELLLQLCWGEVKVMKYTIPGIYGIQSWAVLAHTQRFRAGYAFISCCSDFCLTQKHKSPKQITAKKLWTILTCLVKAALKHLRSPTAHPLLYLPEPADPSCPFAPNARNSVSCHLQTYLSSSPCIPKGKVWEWLLFLSPLIVSLQRGMLITPEQRDVC